MNNCAPLDGCALDISAGSARPLVRLSSRQGPGNTHLVTTVAAALRPAFALGHAVVAIATPDHLAAIEAQLEPFAAVRAARASGLYLPLDADVTLRKLSTAGRCRSC